MNILEIYGTAYGLFQRKKTEVCQKEEAQDSGAKEDEENKQEFLHDKHIIDTVCRIANFVFKNDISNNFINSFVSIRVIFDRQRTFWHDQNSHDSLNVLTGIPEALLKERIIQLEKFTEFIMGLATFINVCNSFSVYLVTQEKNLIFTIEYIFMSVENSMNNVKKHLTKVDVANSFRTSCLKLLNIMLTFYNELFNQ